MKTKTLYFLFALSMLSFFSSYAQDNVHLDCDDALVVCDNQDITIWNDQFGVQELDNTNHGCLLGNEHQSIWFTFTISSGTTLDFDIVPNTFGDDYDFAVYGPDIDCDNLPAPIRCDFSGTDGSTGLSGDGSAVRYDATLNVQAGETYYLLVDNHPNGDQANGFTLNWGGNAVLDCCAAETISYHFEHEDGSQDDTFSICEDVYLDGSQITNPNGNFFMAISRVNTDGTFTWLSAQGSNPNWPGWVSGQPTLVNVTQTFVNDLENPVVFQAGTTYQVTLAINHPECGWVSQNMQFTLTDVSPEFVIVDYYCHDGVYDVTATTQDQNPNHGWGLWETSVEGSISDGDVIGLVSSQSSWQLPALTTVTFTNLDPNKFYFIKHGVWGDNCDWREKRIALNRDCCIDEFEIIAYCDDPCVLDSFPLKVKDQNGDIITILDGATFSWYNATTGETSTNDIVTASEFDHWFLTLTMPDGCIYRLEYKLICCEDDIQLEAYDCPTIEDIAILEAQLKTKKATVDKKTYNKYANYLNAFKGGDSAEDCDPCEDGLFIIRVVDGNGDLVTNFISITWSDGFYANQNIRWGEVNTTYTVTVVVPASNGIDTCTYTDEIIYECREECADLPAPTNLQNNGTTLSWSPVLGAQSYIVSSPSVIRIECCRTGFSMAPVPTTNTFIPLSIGLQSRCFVWQVTAVCSDGSLSPVSVQSCHLPTLIQQDTGDVKDKVSIYPNPNNGNMDIKVELEDASDVTLNVYRFDGTLVRTVENAKTAQRVLDINFQSNLPSGLYFFIFNTSNGTITKRVIIE